MKKKFLIFIPLLFLSVVNFAAGINNQQVSPLPTPTAANVLVGDSITQFGPWQTLLAGADVVNRGVSGDTSSRILQRMNGVLAVKPKKAFLMFGINDFGRGTDPEQVFKNYEKIVAMLRDAKIRVIISSTIKCSANEIHPQTYAINKKVDALNAKLKQFSQANGITYIDINEKLTGANGLDKRYTVDGVHLSLEGYKVWAKLLSPLINEQ